MGIECSFCGIKLDYPEVAKQYPGSVCRQCDKKAVNSAGKLAHFSSILEEGDNPVFIDGVGCWRRYRFGGYVTMRDDDNCPDLEKFYTNHMKD